MRDSGFQRPGIRISGLSGLDGSALWSSGRPVFSDLGKDCQTALQVVHEAFERVEPDDPRCFGDEVRQCVHVVEVGRPSRPSMRYSMPQTSRQRAGRGAEPSPTPRQEPRRLYLHRRPGGAHALHLGRARRGPTAGPPRCAVSGLADVGRAQVEPVVRRRRDADRVEQLVRRAFRARVIAAVARRRGTPARARCASMPRSSDRRRRLRRDAPSASNR